MKELEELTREIREKLPRLKELSDGTIVKSLFNDKRNFITKDAFYQIGYSEDCICLADNVNVNIDGYSYKTSSFEIIGKEPMLNDVLECIKKTVIADKNETAYNIIAHNWNLIHPYLKDQSPELIKFLHSLIKTKQ